MTSCKNEKNHEELMKRIEGSKIYLEESDVERETVKLMLMIKKDENFIFKQF